MKAGSSQGAFGSASRTTVFRAARLTLLSAGVLCAGRAFAQLAGTQVIGHVVDASDRRALEGVVVTATSPSLQGEQVVATDADGNYRVPQLVQGRYTLHLERAGYRPYERLGLDLRAEATIRIDVELLPDTAGSETIVVVARPPTVDVGSATTGTQISPAFIQAIPLTRDDRSFDQLATVAPGVQTDAFGVAIGGATSPENQFVVDGLSTNNSFRGLNGSPVSVEFVDEVNVITGGFMPEYGRATGGVVSAVTKSGGNEFHGSVFGTWSPGATAATPPAVVTDSATFSTRTKLHNRWDMGATLGGYIVKDRLWFFAGFVANQVKTAATRTTNYLDPDLQGSDLFGGTVPEFNTAATGQSPYPDMTFVAPVKDKTTGFAITHPIPGSEIRHFSTDTSYQAIGKLTFLLNSDHRFSLSVIGRANSGFFSQPNALSASTSRLTTNEFLDITGKWQGSFLEKRILVDLTVGWHHEPRSSLPSDGSGPGDSSGFAGQPGVITGNYHNLTEFGQLYGPVPSQCTPTVYGTRVFYPCPIGAGLIFGGPGEIGSSNADTIQANAVVTWLARALGSHVAKLGIGAMRQSGNAFLSDSGGHFETEDTAGRAFYGLAGFGVLTGPDTPRLLPTYSERLFSTSIGGFIQDSWNLLDRITLNIGVRYDAQSIYGNDGILGMALPNQWSPRIGLIWDPTYRGRSKIYANFGTYYENVPLQIAEQYFPGVPLIYSNRSFRADVVGSGNVCNPIRDPNYKVSCTNPKNLLPAVQPVLSSNAGWQDWSASKAYVDPNIRAQSLSEVIVGGEYEVLADARLGATFTRRWMNRVVEDLSNDEGATFFIGNPGHGIAESFPTAVRNYTAITVFFTKSFAQLWQGQLSYTYQSLTGNYEGLVRTGSGSDVQNLANVNYAFDRRDLLVNASGRLPGDITHTIKAFGSYEWVVLPTLSLTLGGALTANSGTPYSYLGSDPLYQAGTVFILPRGNAGTLPWVWNLDLKLGLSIRTSADGTVSIAVACFNVLNSAQVTGVDQNYTYVNVRPVPGGTAQGLKGDPSTGVQSTGAPYTHDLDNPNYGRPTTYQAPRIFRFSARVTF